MSYLEYKNYYFIGIGGIGMSAMAEYVLSINKNIAGYDREESFSTNRLESLGIKIINQDNPDYINLKFKENTLVINFSEKFLPRRGRVNCSLNDNGKWRWFGTQFTVRN